MGTKMAERMTIRTMTMESRAVLFLHSLCQQS